MISKKEYDVIVVGTGAGGSTVAREMTLRGKKVLLLERGGKFDWMGNTLTVAMVVKGFGITRSRENYQVVFGDNYGGLSNLSAGTAIPPQKEVFDPVGIDLTQEAEEARKDMWVQKLPEELIGDTNLRLLHAANDAGYNWDKLEKFIDAEKCEADCGDCMLGCKKGAKWTARVYDDEAVKNGADLRLHTTIKNVMVEDGKVIGVEGRKFGKKVKYYGKIVVLSAGMDNTHILRQAGIHEAGNGFTCDWLQFVGGIIPGINTLGDNPMSVGTMEHYETDGLIVMPVFPNWSQFALIISLMGIKHLPKFANFWKYSGMMVKVRDETAGEIYKGTSFSKPVTENDRKKLDKGVDIIKKVFRKAGVKDDSLFALKPFGAHPAATCRIGVVADENLETEITNLYCCDSSVLPVSMGTPLVWTMVSLGKRLAKHLDIKLKAE